LLDVAKLGLYVCLERAGDRGGELHVRIQSSRLLAMEPQPAAALENASAPVAEVNADKLPVPRAVRRYPKRRSSSYA
jgi:hypothetical protein